VSFKFLKENEDYAPYEEVILHHKTSSQPFNWCHYAKQVELSSHQSPLYGVRNALGFFVNSN
jgi:hypothetical protein